MQLAKPGCFESSSLVCGKKADLRLMVQIRVKGRARLEPGSHSVQGVQVLMVLHRGQHKGHTCPWAEKPGDTQALRGQGGCPPHFCWKVELLRLDLTKGSCVQRARARMGTFTSNGSRQGTSSKPGPALGTFSSVTLSFPSLGVSKPLFIAAEWEPE